MLSQAENDLLTRTGPGTPAGELLRRYWQPAALSEELPVGGAPVPVPLLGEELVLFRDEDGRPGLLGLHCSHRAADLSYGRLEDGGLRCLYHGWLYDIHGNCLEQPGEPAGSDFKSKIHHPAYPCHEIGGIIYAYMGPGEPPPIPPYEFIAAPETHRANTKVYQECNFLQANEGNIDPDHLSFLHRLHSDDPESAQSLNVEDTAPAIEVEDTPYGVRIYCVRKVHGDRNYVRVTNFLMPNFCAVSGTDDGYTVNWHVPIDDTHHWRYMVRFSRKAPMEDKSRWMGRSTEVTDDYRMVRNPSNRYLQDRASMDKAFIGLGPNFLVHDAYATQGEGPIQDRTTEHLGQTDKGIIAARRMLLRAIREVQEGQDPPGVFRDERTGVGADLVARSDALLPRSADWRDYWKKATEEEVSFVKEYSVSVRGSM